MRRPRLLILILIDILLFIGLSALYLSRQPQLESAHLAIIASVIGYAAGLFVYKLENTRYRELIGISVGVITFVLIATLFRFDDIVYFVSQIVWILLALIIVLIIDYAILSDKKMRQFFLFDKSNNDDTED